MKTNNKLFAVLIALLVSAGVSFGQDAYSAKNNLKGPRAKNSRRYTPNTKVKITSVDKEDVKGAMAKNTTVIEANREGKKADLDVSKRNTLKGPRFKNKKRSVPVVTPVTNDSQSPDLANK